MHRPLAERPTFLLSQVGAHVAGRFAAQLAPYDIHPRYVGVLSALDAEPGQSQQQLGESLGIHRNSMVALLDELEARGLVERRRSPTDRRVWALYPTAAADTLLATADQVLDALEAEILGGLPARDRRQLVGMLSQIVAASSLGSGVHPNLRR